MKVFSVLILILCVVASACGGGTTPTSPSVPSTSSSPLKVSPNTTTLAVGQYMIFTASGGDGFNYVFEDAEPFYGFKTELISINSVRVTAVSRAYGTTGKLKLTGFSNGQMVSVEATITIK